MADKMFSIRQAAASGTERVRRPTWANGFDHLKIDIDDGQPGPWLHLFSPMNQEFNGRDPVDVLAFAWLSPLDLHSEEFVAYSGPLPESDEYKEEAAKFAGSLAAARGIVTEGGDAPAAPVSQAN